MDDYSACVTGPSPHENTRLIQDSILPKVVEWNRTSGATFEPEKTQFVHFTKKRVAQLEALPKLELMGSEIVPNSEAKLVGIILDSNLNFSSHAARAAKRGETPPWP